MDPLTFCFHIERKRGDSFHPCGFVFGGFARIEDGRRAVVLNSLHVRPRSPDLREGVVRALETGLCAPLDIELIGIANVFGGQGPLPADYATREVKLTRYRALANRDGPIADVYDDIGVTVNGPESVTDLYWRSLRV